MAEQFIIPSPYDQLPLAASLIAAKEPKAVIQFSHGMVEHKERYYPFMTFLAENGYTCVIHDHRGHGASVRDAQDLGFFYTNDAHVIAKDLYTVNQWIGKQYPNCPIYLFSHSMGTLVARVFLQSWDNHIDKLVLCGPPTQNPLAGVGVALAKLDCSRRGERNRSKRLQQLVFGGYNKFEGHENAWVCSNMETVRQYNADPLCHYQFTSNGFLNLFELVQLAFRKKEYGCQNPSLPILMLAGGDDPVIQSEKKFARLNKFFSSVGYQHIIRTIFPGKRHELINETGHLEIWRYLLNFFEK